MSKSKRTALEKIQTLKTKNVAQLFFFSYLTPNIVTKILHKKAWNKCKEKTGQGFVMPYIRDCLNEWKKEGFIEISPVKIPFRVERKRNKKIVKSYYLKNYGYRLNFEPLYRYCKENYNIEFTEEEKEIVNKRVGFEFMRKRILREYPNEDIINATIKFYIKHYGLLHLEILNKEHKKGLVLIERIAEKDLKRAEEFLKRKKKKHRLSSKDKELVNVEQMIYNQVMEQLYTTFIKGNKPIEDLKNFAKFQSLLLYVTSYKKNPELISSINKKFKKALGIGF